MSKPTKLINLEVDEVSLVDKGANQGAKVELFKRDSIVSATENNQVLNKHKEDSMTINKMSDAEKAYMDKENMDDEQKAAFMSLSPAERRAKMGGMKKSNDSSADLEKRLDDIDKMYRDQLAKRDEEIAKLAGQIQFAALEKRAKEEFPLLKGTDAQKAALLGEVEKFDVELKKYALEVLKSCEGIEKYTSAISKSETEDNKGEDLLQKKAIEYSKQYSVPLSKAYIEVSRSQEGRDAYKNSVN